MPDARHRASPCRSENALVESFGLGRPFLPEKAQREHAQHRGDNLVIGAMRGLFEGHGALQQFFGVR